MTSLCKDLSLVLLKLSPSPLIPLPVTDAMSRTVGYGVTVTTTLSTRTVLPSAGPALGASET